jgi:hypothetical protein
VFVLLEKTVAFGQSLSRAMGIGLLIWGAMLLIQGT